MKHDYDLVIIGAGSAGMIAGEVAGQIGVKAALIERVRIGGDCLWTGCVPSKALLASARAAHTAREAGKYGLFIGDLRIDSAKVWERIRAVQRDIAQTDDNAEKYEHLGVDVLLGQARFAGDHRIDVDGRRATARWALVCTGSRPAAPGIPGLGDHDCLTSENVFELDSAPESLLIVGGGPIGVEMAQGMNRLGVRVTLLQRAGRILERDEPELADALLATLRQEGVDAQLNVQIERAEVSEGKKTLIGRTLDGERAWSAEQVLVAVGRTPNIEGLDLERAGIQSNLRGIVVDRKLRTSAKWVFAAGDCAGRYLFTHSAGAEAAIAIRNMFFPATTAPDLVPWTTFTEPELAHVGMTSDEARRKLGEENMRVYEWDLAHSDRARADGMSEGKVIAVTDAKFRLLGAHILAPCAGEMISQFTLAIRNGLRLTPDFANMIQVYPTYATSVSQLAAEATYPQLRKPFLRTVRRIKALFSG